LTWYDEGSDEYKFLTVDGTEAGDPIEFTDTSAVLNNPISSFTNQKISGVISLGMFDKYLNMGDFEFASTDTFPAELTTGTYLHFLDHPKRYKVERVSDYTIRIDPPLIKDVHKGGGVTAYPRELPTGWFSVEVDFVPAVEQHEFTHILILVEKEDIANFGIYPLTYKVNCADYDDTSKNDCIQDDPNTCKWCHLTDTSNQNKCLQYNCNNCGGLQYDLNPLDGECDAGGVGTGGWGD